MKVSLNWLKQFTEIDLSVDELVQKIGAQLGAVEEIIDIGKKYQGIVIVRVVSCEKHPNADKLSLCRIDDGGITPGVNRDDQGCIQVVCGAPNVREGLLAAWLPPGATVPSTYDKEPFVLEARELRGTVSNGMLASASELAISDDHTGIVEIDIDAHPGESFAEAYELNDYVIDIENKMFTHRPDCFGILGVAREVAGITGKQFTSPDWYKEPLGRFQPGKERLTLEVRNDAPALVPRFMAIAMAGIQVKPSPLMIQTYLMRVGLRPINNIVDMTNYLMVLTGQPLHAYDADKLRQVAGSGDTVKLETRLSRQGEKLKLLTGKEITLEDDSTILITSNDVPVGVGGVMGGGETEVDASTKNIVIECANFDMYSIRKTSMKYGLFTDAVTRFNKGQSPLQNDRIIEEAVVMAQGLTQGTVASDLIDQQGEIPVPAPVQVAADFINARLGLSVSADAMADVLRHVEFDVVLNEEGLVATPPFWRTDIAIPEDVVEEVGRLIGFDQLPIELPMRSIKPAARNELFDLKAKLREILSRFGANEVLTYSFVHGNLLDKVGQDKDKAFQLSNALSPDLQYYRLSLAPSLLEKVYPNIKAGYSEFALFEVGKAHVKGLQDREESSIPREEERVALVITAEEKIAQKNYIGSPYYQALKYLDGLLKSMNLDYRVTAIDREPKNEEGRQLLGPFDVQRSSYIRVNEEWVGVVAELRPSVKKALKLPPYTAVFEVNVKQLAKFYTGASDYRPISRFPKVQQDISLQVSGDLAFGELFAFSQQKLKEIAPENTAHSWEPIDIYQRKNDTKHVTLRLIIASYERMLTDQEVNALLDEIAAAAHEKFSAKRL